MQKQHSMLPSLTTENRLLLLLTVSERWAPEGIVGKVNHDSDSHILDSMLPS